MDTKEINNDTSLNTPDCSKEFWFLNQLVWKLPFELYDEPVLCKKNFFTTFARYIEELKNKTPDSREQEIQKFIKSIVDGEFGSGIDLLKNVDYFLSNEIIKRYEEIWNMDEVNMRKQTLNYDGKYKVRSDWKTMTVFSWVSSNRIPDWYYEWSKNSWLLNEIKDKNLENLAQALTMKK